MGRIPEVVSKERVSSTKWNQFRGDYVSQTDKELQSIGGIVYIGRRVSDPDTTGWGEDEKAYLWFNLTEGKYKYWNGAAIVAFPSAGGAGAPVDASYVTINAEAGLTAEIQHANIVDEAQKHTPKIHTHVEADVTDLDHDALKIKGVTVDDSGIGADKYLKYDGANVVYGTLPAGSTYKLAPNYTVYKVGATYYAMEEDGDTSINGANAATVVNAAIAALTGGRDHMETVLLKGEITTIGAIQLDSFTRLAITGELKAGTTGFDMITFSDTSQYLVDICGGGVINGNSQADDGIHLEGPSQPSYRSFIHDLTIRHTLENGIWTEGGARIIGSNMYLYECGASGVGDGMHIDSYDCKFSNIVVGEPEVHGIHNDSTNNHFANCKTYGAKQNGFHCNGARAGYTNCVAQENDGHGFYIDQANQVFTSCIADRNSRTNPGTYHGFNIVGDHIALTGCAAVDFGNDCQEDGIHIASTASDVRISGFVASDQQGMNIYVDASASDISIEAIDDDYQTQAGAWANPSVTKVSAFNGRQVRVYNSDTAPNYRIYTYMNGAWHYFNATA